MANKARDAGSALLRGPAETDVIRDAVEQLLKIEPRVAWPDRRLRAKVTRGDVAIIRALVAIGIIAIAAFAVWFLSEDRIGVWWLHWPLTGFFAFTLLLTLYEWFCYLGVRTSAPQPERRAFSVDVLTTWCPGEPKEMVVASLKAIVRMRLPHTTWLCDEGNDPMLKEVCHRLGVRHVTREDKSGAKAGNINNALRQATGEIAIIMDPDHEPAPWFLERLLGHFDDPQVGFVQSVQGYYNQSDGIVARGAAEQTYHFYGPIMTGMNTWGTTQAIGANCAFRRAALDSIEGHATGLAEDMATTLKLYAQGWKSVYVPELLSRGLTPSSFGAYVKQQIKWSCGVWDILIESYWRALRQLSWANRLHFLYNGIFYFRGLFVLFGVLVPIVALTTGLPPWRISLMEFLQWYGPVLAVQVLVRQAAQRWLLEPRERGFHIVGGALINAVWWVHLTGVVCSILRIRVPYIPTPKDDAFDDAWLLAAPNLAIAGASLAAIGYGIWWDWSPFAALMAGFALVNAAMLGGISLAAQQRTVSRLRHIGRGLTVATWSGTLSRGKRAARDGIAFVLRQQPLVIAVAVLSFVIVSVAGTSSNPLHRFWAEIENRTEKVHGGFLLGAFLPEADTLYDHGGDVNAAMAEIDGFERQIGTHLSVVSLYQPWGPDAVANFPVEQLTAIRDRGALPMITWEPLIHTFPAAAKDEHFANNWKVFKAISEGAFDSYLEAYATNIREFGSPVLIRFAHEPDNPAFAWSPKGYNTPEEYRAAWRYVVEYFDGMGAANVTWIFSPWRSEAIDAYYPGDLYADWVGLTILNYGQYGDDGEWLSFADLYEPFARKLAGKSAPVMIAEFGSTDFGGDRGTWLADALAQIGKRPEIGGIVMFNSAEDRNWPLDWSVEDRSAPIDWRPSGAERDDLFAAFGTLAAMRDMRPVSRAETGDSDGQPENRRILGQPGHWTLMADGKPFYIKGVAYTVGQGWRTPGDPTRAVVEDDFARIAAMGANTVRRYASGWQDHNVLAAARRHNLKVMMGFWLDADIDYARDHDALAAIEKRIIDRVERLRDDPSILSWTVGNESWGLAKHYFGQPHLTDVRNAYLQFVERLAKRIKTLDPERPVFTSLEYSSELPGALHAVAQLAQSVDAVGINAYYERHLERLNGLVSYFAGGMPWLASEFGPDGYWDIGETRWTATGFPVEPKDAEKARQYADRWQRFVAGRAPDNIGGVAFAWTDRFEGSSTWFGLTDFKRRAKPAYHALQRAWTDKKPDDDNWKDISAEMSVAQTADGIVATITMDQAPDNCRIEWQLVAEGTFEKQQEWKTGCNKGKVTSSIRPNPGRFRIHGWIVTGGVRSITTSAPVLAQ